MCYFQKIIINRKRIEAEEAERKRKQEINRIAAEQQRIKNRRVQAVKNKRREINLKYGTYFPTIVDLHEILEVVLIIDERTKRSERDRFIQQLGEFGYYRYDDLAELLNRPPTTELFSDRNNFRNNIGSYITTFRKIDENGELIASVRCKFPNAGKDIIELYAMELMSEYRNRIKSKFDFQEINFRILKKSPWYIKSGSTFYWYEINDGTLEVVAYYNFDASADIVTERLNNNTLKVNMYSNLTDINLNRGDVIKFDAWGSVTLGFLAGSTSPAGVNGFELYSIDSRHKHGSLIGRIDNGNWLYIGNARTIIAPSSGRLELKINDTDRSNNDGFFYVTYSIEKQKRSN